MNWYYATNGAQKGPIPIEDLKSRIASGEVAPTDLAWREGMSDWMPVATIAELKSEPPAPRAETSEPAFPAAAPAPEPYRPPTQASAPAPGYQPVSQMPPSQGLAIASMVCGIIALIFCCGWYVALPLSIAAIVMGHIATSKAKADPQRFGGRGMARAGLITGYLALIGSILVAIFFAQFAGLSETEMQEKIINWFPAEQQQQLRDQFEQQRQQRGR